MEGRQVEIRNTFSAAKIWCWFEQLMEYATGWLHNHDTEKKMQKLANFYLYVGAFTVGDYCSERE